MLKTARLYLPIVALAIALIWPSELVGQGCYSCSSICGANAHLDDCSGQADMGFSSGCIPNYCHNGLCHNVHYFDCFSGLNGLTGSEVNEVIRAAEVGDVRVLAVFLRSSNQVSLHRGRNAIQVGGCKGGFLASIVLTPEAVAALLPLGPFASDVDQRTKNREIVLAYMMGR